MQQPLLPVTVKDGRVVPVSDAQANYFAYGYVACTVVLFIGGFATLIYFAVNPSVMKGDE